MELDFRYLIASQGNFAVVSLVGDITSSCAGELEKLMGELNGSNGHLVILNFREVQNIEKSTYRALVLLQTKVRKELQGHLRVTGINPKLKPMLVDNGVVRPEEICDNVKAALTQLMKIF